jgi:hypothetical protein
MLWVPQGLAHGFCCAGATWPTFSTNARRYYDPATRAQPALERPRHRHRLAAADGSTPLLSAKDVAGRPIGSSGDAEVFVHEGHCMTGSERPARARVATDRAGTSELIAPIVRGARHLRPARQSTRFVAQHRPALHDQRRRLYRRRQGRSEEAAGSADQCRCRRRLAAAARSAGARLVHVSTDFVFDGVSGVPYRRTQPTPLGVYGRTKLAGEAQLRPAARSTLIVRTAWVYASQGRQLRPHHAAADGGAR